MEDVNPLAETLNRHHRAILESIAICEKAGIRAHSIQENVGQLAAALEARTAALRCLLEAVDDAVNSKFEPQKSAARMEAIGKAMFKAREALK